MALTKVQIDGVEFSDSTDLNVDNGTLVVDATNNRVGVGTASPAAKTQISSGSSGVTPIVHADDLFVENNANAGITIGTPNTSVGRIVFGDPENNQAGGLFYSHVNNNLVVDVNGGTALTIDASQRVGIGTTSPGENVEIAASTNPTIRLNDTRGYTSDILQAGSGLVLRNNDASGPVIFKAGGDTERARIDSSGRLLVGTSSCSVETTQLLSGNSGSSLGDAKLIISRGSDTPNNNQFLGSIYFSTSDQGKYGGSIIAARDGGTWSTSSKPTRLMFSTTADGASSPTERMRITTGGYLKASNTGSYQGTAGTYHEFRNSANDEGLYLHSTNASFTSRVILGRATRAASSLYGFLRFDSNSGTDTEFHLRGDGNAFADGSWSGGGADYAEYFEWSDGNTTAEDRRGISVVLDDDKIREAVAGEEPIGVISGNPSVVGDAAWNKWNNKYLRDDYGTYIQEDYEVEDEDGNTVTQQRRKLNPDYDPDVEYVSREDRPEWGCVGLMGKLRIRKGQPTGSRWIKMRDISDSVEEWLVR